MLHNVLYLTVTCTGELNDCLSELVGDADVDLGNIRVTLDVICLTLPSADEDPKVSNGRPCYNRYTSFSSQTSMTAVDAEQSLEVSSPVKNLQNEYVISDLCFVCYCRILICFPSIMCCFSFINIIVVQCRLI